MIFFLLARSLAQLPCHEQNEQQREKNYETKTSAAAINDLWIIRSVVIVEQEKDT